LTRINSGLSPAGDNASMNLELIQKYGGAVPRYTSYPTAPHFGPGVTASDYAAWLGSLRAGQPLSLYIHIPFCDSLCWFCGCNTKVTRQYKPIEGYLDGLLREIEIVARYLPGVHPVAHLHFGGGSPTLLSAVDFACLMSAIGDRFPLGDGAEIAIEIDPRDVDANKVRAYARAGVNRASLGIQDFDEKVQRAINRVQPYQVTAQVVAELRTAGINRLNFDLMYGLPHQTEAGIAAMVEQAVSLRPDRLALFGYAHVPWMKKHQRLIPEEALPDAEARFRQQAVAAARLVDAGYERIGLDHFARPEDPLAQAASSDLLHRNFQGYTADDAGALIGLGASSIGALSQGYVQNHTDTRSYLDDIWAGLLPVAKGIALSDDDRCRRSAIERLMCDMRLDLRDARYASLVEEAQARLSGFEQDGLITSRGDALQVEEAGRPFVRQIAAVFDAYLNAPSAGRHSAAV
jgi:oxygen-independent coproporphyrinogen-3 oxidase